MITRRLIRAHMTRHMPHATCPTVFFWATMVVAVSDFFVVNDDDSSSARVLLLLRKTFARSARVSVRPWARRPRRGERLRFSARLLQPMGTRHLQKSRMAPDGDWGTVFFNFCNFLASLPSFSFSLPFFFLFDFYLYLIAL